MGAFAPAEADMLSRITDRKVVQWVAAYAVTAWALTQVVEAVSKASAGRRLRFAANSHGIGHREAGMFFKVKEAVSPEPLGAWTPVVYRRHIRHSPVGSVRWSWSETDEGLWHACDEGCCKADELKRR